MGVHCNKTHDFLSNWLGQITLDHLNKAYKVLYLLLVGLLDSCFIAGQLPEGLLNIDYPHAIVDQEGNLGRILFNPIFLSNFSKFLQGFLRDIFKRTSHYVEDLLQVHLDFANKLKISSELYILLSNAGMHTFSEWSDTFLKEFQSLHRRNDFWHVNHHFLGGITIGKNIQKICW